MSSWGNLRLQLQMGAPGVAVDLIDSWLNLRYSKVLNANDWTGVKYHYTLLTTAAYQSGQTGMNPEPGEDSADLILGNDTVSIINTPGQLPQAGMRFYVPGDTVFYTIESVNDASSSGAVTAASVQAAGNGYILNQILNLVQGSAVGGQVQVASLGPNGSVTGLTLYAGGVGYVLGSGLLTTVGEGATITIVSVGAGGIITGAIIAAGGVGPYVTGQVLGIVQAGGSGGTATVASVDENGVIVSVTLTSPGSGYSAAPDLATTTSSGCTVNVTAISTISFTLDRPYEGNGVDPVGTGYLQSPYVYMQHIYVLPADVRTVMTCLDPVTGFPLKPFSKDNLDSSVGPRTLVQDPQSYAIYDDTNELTPPVQHQIEFFPPPLYARGIVIEYLHAAAGWDGSTTSASPMPWVSDEVLIEGCRADIARYLAGQTENAQRAQIYILQAKDYEAQFDANLHRLLMVEHSQRRTRVPLQMAPRFTRHRMARSARGMVNVWRGGLPGGPQ